MEKPILKQETQNKKQIEIELKQESNHKKRIENKKWPKGHLDCHTKTQANKCKTKDILMSNKDNQELMKYDQYQPIHVRGSNAWPLNEKIQFMHSLNLNDFSNKFKPDYHYTYHITELSFSDDGKYSFICKFYLGEIK